MKSLGIQVWMGTQYRDQMNGQVQRRIGTLKQLMQNFVKPRQNNWSSILPAIAAAINGAPHESLGMSPYHALYGGSWKIFDPVQRSASNVTAVDDILNKHEGTTREADMARKHASFRQTVQADKGCKPITKHHKNGSRVLIRGRPYTFSPGQSKKLEPHWFGPFKVLENLPDTENYKIHLPPRMACQKPYFHGSSLKESRDNNPDRFQSRRMDKPAPILIDNAKEYEAELEFVTGRDGAGFHMPGPAITTGRRGYFGGDPRPAPSVARPCAFPACGPISPPPVLKRTPLGNGRGWGQGE